MSSCGPTFRAIWQILQRAIGYRYCRFHGLFNDEMAVVARRKDGSLAFRWAQGGQGF